MEFTKLHDVAAYIFSLYPKGTFFSRARFVKLIYLSDWKHSLTKSRQITDTVWYFHNYGPYVEAIIDQLADDSDFIVKAGSTFEGERSISIGLAKENVSFDLTESEKKAIEVIIEATRNLSWDKFINAVYTTYPVRVSARHSNLNLVELAKEYLQSIAEMQAETA